MANQSNPPNLVRRTVTEEVFDAPDGDLDNIDLEDGDDMDDDEDGEPDESPRRGGRR